MATSEFNNSRLQKLKHSNYEIADGEPDIRGWDVKDGGSQRFGKVEELLFEESSRKVRYMVVNLDNNDFSLNKRDVLIPIGLAELHKKDDDVILNGVTSEQLSALPEYKDDISSSDESMIRNIFAGFGVAGLGAAAASADTDAEFYNHDHFNESNLFKNRKGNNADEAGTTLPVIEEELQVGKRTIETGGAYIRSRIVETPVEETVRLNEEHVKVERTHVDKPIGSTDFDTFKEGVIEMKEYGEVPVISKEARVVEEVTIGKNVEERNETIRDTLRSTEVDIENIEGSNKSQAPIKEEDKRNN